MWKDWTEVPKNIAATLGFLGAAVFFFYKVATGYHIVNASISIECTRRKREDGQEEFLAVSTTLKKGERGTVALRDGWARIKYGESEKFYFKKFIGIDRLDYNKKDGEWWKSLDNRYINLAPGEESSFSCLFLVPPNESCEVEIAVFGITVHFTRPGRKPGLVQWRASAISLPQTRDGAETDNKTPLKFAV